MKAFEIIAYIALCLPGVSLIIALIWRFLENRQCKRIIKAFEELEAEMDHYGVETLEELEAAKARERDPFPQYISEKERSDETE